MADPIRELAELLTRLPGVGRRTGTRLAFHLLGAPEDYARKLGEVIATIHERINPCTSCGNFAETDPCSICDDAARNRKLICVVAGVPDLWAIENTAEYRGQYHVLHGLLSPLDGIGPDDLNLDRLRERVRDDEIAEVIVATRPSVEGEATSLLIRQTLEGLDVSLSRIASGIPHGGELEYADRMTLGRALSDRREL
ncbi:MAG: recombination protein RecR [Deltaproteobacteria bacterium]|nr:recombination protein RecR [Deltaproteobacteria bacterium]